MSAPTVFDALADPTRRRLLVNLAAHSPKTATQLAQQYTRMSRQGLLRHLGVLKAAGLVMVQQRGREKRYELTPAPLTELAVFVQAIQSTWDKRLLRLKAFVENDTPRP